MNGRQASSAGHGAAAAVFGKQQQQQLQLQQPSLVLPASNGGQAALEQSTGSGRTPLREVASTTVVSVYLPELDIRRRHEIDVDESLWSAKVRLLATLEDGSLRDSLNCSFYLPPANGRAGKFLDDERPLRDYPLSAGDLMLEFKHKRRVYRQPAISLGKLRRLHTRENLKQLMSAVKGHALDRVTKLLAKGLDPNFQDSESGETPLTTAATLSNCHSMVTALVGSGSAHLDFRNRQSLTPMHVAAACGNAEAITVLLELGASPNSRDRKGLTALFYVCATRLGSVPCAELLLRDYAAIGCQDQLGYTELHQACKNGHVQLAEMLVFYGADMNARNADGWTPLHSCVAANQIPCLKMLLQRGASRQVVDLSSQTPMLKARLLNKAEASAVLEAHDDSLVLPFTEVPRYSQRRRLTGTNLEVLRRLAESDVRLSASSASLLNHDSLASATATLSSGTGVPCGGSMTRSYYSGSLRGGGGSSSNDYFYDDNDLSADGLEHWASGSLASLGHLSLYLPRERRSLTNELNEVLGARSEDGHWNRSLRSSASVSSSYKEAAAGAGAADSAMSSERSTMSVGTGASGAASPPPAIRSRTSDEPQHGGVRPADGSLAAAQPPAVGGDPGAGNRNSRIKAVVLTKGKKGYGFVLRGAKAAQLKKLDAAFEPTDLIPALQYLDTIEAGSVAEKAGLKAGDFIAEINGVDVTRTSHEDLVQRIKACGATLIMKVISPLLASDHLGKTMGSYESQAAPSAAQQPASLGSPEQVTRGVASFGKSAAIAAHSTLPAAAAKPEATAAAAPSSAIIGVGAAADDESAAAGQLTVTQKHLPAAVAATLSAVAATKLASIRARPSSQLFVTSAEMENIMASAGLPLPAAAAGTVAEGQTKEGRMPPPPPPPRAGSSSLSSSLTVGGGGSGQRADRTEQPSAAATATLSRFSSAASSGPATDQQRPLGAAASMGSRRPSASGSAASAQSGSEAAGVGHHASEALHGSSSSVGAVSLAMSLEYSAVFIPPAPSHPAPAVPLPSLLGASEAAGPEAERPTKGFLPRTLLPQRNAVPERGGAGAGGRVSSQQQQLPLPPPPPSLPPPPPPSLPPPPPPPQLLLQPPGDASSSTVGRSGVVKVSGNFKPNKDAASGGGGGGATADRNDPCVSSSRSSSIGSATSLTSFGDSLRNAVAAVADKRHGSMAGDESLTGRSKTDREELDARPAALAAGVSSSLDADLQKALQKRQASLVVLSQTAPIDSSAGDTAIAAAPPPSPGVNSAFVGASAPDAAKGSQAAASDVVGSTGCAGSAISGGATAVAAPPAAAVAAAQAEPGGAAFTEMAERVRLQWLAARKADQRPPPLVAASPAAVAKDDKPAKKLPPPVPAKKVTVRMEHHSLTKRASATSPTRIPMPAAGVAESATAAAAASAMAEAHASLAAAATTTADIRPPLGPGIAETGQDRGGSGGLGVAPAACADDDLELPPPPPPAFVGPSDDDDEQYASAALPLPPSSFASGHAAASADEFLPPPPLPTAALPGLELPATATAVAADSLPTAAAPGDGAARSQGGGQPAAAAAGLQGPHEDLPYISKRVDAWSVADVGDWLEAHGLGEYRAAFADNCIDGESLVNLTRDDVKELGLDKVGPRVKFEKEVKKLAYFLTNGTGDA